MDAYDQAVPGDSLLHEDLSNNPDVFDATPLLSHLIQR